MITLVFSLVNWGLPPLQARTGEIDASREKAAVFISLLAAQDDLSPYEADLHMEMSDPDRSWFPTILIAIDTLFYLSLQDLRRKTYPVFISFSPHHSPTRPCLHSSISRMISSGHSSVCANKLKSQKPQVHAEQPTPASEG